MADDAEAERQKRVRLAELHREVQSGTYSVNANELSRKIVEQHIAIGPEPRKRARRRPSEN